jgi:plasmid stabilization system protein ParE
MAANWRVLRSAAAKADLYEIWSYIAAHDDLAADRWLQKFDAAIARLAAYPGLGSSRPELPGGIFAFSVKPFLILYIQNPEQEQVTIIRVIDARRDFESLFLA